MNKLILSVAIICIALNTHAQVKIKFGKVSLEEIKKEKSEIQESAGAEVLAEYGELHFRFDRLKGLAYYFEYHKRIKIYDKSGYDHANVSIPLYGRSGANGESIGIIRAATYNLEDGKVVKTKLSGSNIVDDEVTDWYTVKKITFPQVKEGSVIEYKYTLTSDRIADVPDWTFQEDIPVVWSQYTFKIPEWFKFRTIGQGFVNFAINKNESESGTDPALPGSTWLVNKSTWAAENVAPLEQEEYISSVENFVSKLRFQMLSYQLPGYPITEIANTYYKYNKRMIEHGSFGQALERNNFLKEDALRIAGSGSDKEKAFALYTYVRNEIAWDDFIGVYGGDARQAYKEKKGSAADINFILIMMMRHAGLIAEPVILSTRSNGYPHPVYPEDDKFNYTLAAVNLDNSWHLLDASAKGYPFGKLPVKCLNGQGWMVSKTSPGWIPLQNSNNSGIKTVAKLDLHENGTLDGQLKVTSTGYKDISNRIKLYRNGDEEFVNDLDEDLIDWSIDSASFDNKDNVYASLTANYHMKNSEYEGSDIIYLNPLIINVYDENPFKTEQRVLPVDFPYGTTQQYIMELNIPEGYVVEELPAPTVFQLPGKAAVYQFSATAMGQKISIVNNVKINKLVYNTDEYGAIRKFFEMMITKQGEQIVIKKI